MAITAAGNFLFQQAKPCVVCSKIPWVSVCKPYRDWCMASFNASSVMAGLAYVQYRVVQQDDGAAESKEV